MSLVLSKPDHLAHGDKFGDLTVLRKVKQKGKRGPRYECGCACGRRTTVKGSKLRKGEVTSCGKC